jgi:hypothetical protein
MKKFIFTVLGLLTLVSLTAQNSKIQFINSKIKVDGNLDEYVWSQLEENTNFHNMIPTDIGLAKNQTSVKIFHDGEYIYVGAIYNDTTEKRQVSSLKRDVSIGISDAFIMVLDTQNQQQNGTLFAVNAYGTQVDALVEKVNTGYGLNFSWNTVWKARTIVKGTQKVVEMAIPFKALNISNKNSKFGVQFYVRDIKNNSWTILTDVSRNYLTFDLRFTRTFIVENLPKASKSKFTVTPSITSNFQKEVLSNTKNNTFKPSLDVQHNVTSSLKLDATINPDFSQIDVDQQVTNLTRFSVFFPEQRNFFIENSDLFSNLGVQGVNPFYSRRIGADNSIKFGLKLSGNISPKMRLGILNVQTNEEDVNPAQNFGVFVAEQQLSKNFTTTGFFVNRQASDSFNRVFGVNLNFKSNNNKWIALANMAKSSNDGVSGNNNFYHAGVWYNTRGLSWNASLKQIDENYITDVGFTPRLYNYDAINDQIVREGYYQMNTGIEYEKFYDTSHILNSFRIINYNNDTYFSTDGSLMQSSHFLNSALFFNDLSAVYYVYKHDHVNLVYGFDPLRNGNALLPGKYNFGILKIGYNSANNQKLRYRVNFQKGNYYDGKRTAAGAYVNFQLLPFANVQLNYDVNTIDLHLLGKETFHLTRFTGEVFFNNRLNWTTYVQYNTQRDNFNVNTRLQWEYKPLSYVYLVVSDNFNKDMVRTNWGIAFKVNYRFDF